MSSRKRKREKRGQTSEPEAESTAPAESTEEGGEAEEAEAEPAQADEAHEGDEAEAPAVSEISELKPRRKRKRAEKPEEPEPPDPAASETEPAEVVEDEEEEDEEGFADDTAKEAPKTRAQLKRVLESLIFVSDQVITAQQLGRITKTKIGDVREALAELTIDFEGRGIELVEVNGGYQFRSAAASAAYVRVLVAARPVRLTRAQLETLALIAYRQPITRPEVDDVRGVDSGSAIKVLLDRELIKILGRKDDAGRPLLYGTTPFFLEFFGMNTMQELPTLREFTELSDEHRELFKAKTNEIGDLSAEADIPIAVTTSDSEFEPEPEPELEVAADAEVEVAADAEADVDIAADANDELEVAADEDLEPSFDANDEVEVAADEDLEPSAETDPGSPDDDVEPS